MEVVFERGGLKRLGTYLASLTPGDVRNVLLLASPSRRFVDAAIAAMPGRQVRVFDRARVHVPAATVTAALAEVDGFAPECIVALGGGSVIGLGKALRLQRDTPYLAIPTTYAGSEMTNVYGVTENGLKRTGRDERVRPAMVLYDAELTLEMPDKLTVQSLCNSLAQILSALSTASVSLAETQPWVAELWQVMGSLADAPKDPNLRERALRAASAAGRVIDQGTMGWQHKLAHKIGGRFDLPHAAVHSALLPAFLAWLRCEQPDLMAAIDQCTGESSFEAALSTLLRSAGLPACPRELPVPIEALQGLADNEPKLPPELLRAMLKA